MRIRSAVFAADLIELYVSMLNPSLTCNYLSTSAPTLRTDKKVKRSNKFDVTLTGTFHDSGKIEKLNAGTLIFNHARNGSEGGELVGCSFGSCVRAFAKERGLYKLISG